MYIRVWWRTQTEICAAGLVDIIHAVVSGVDGCLFCYGHARIGPSLSLSICLLNLFGLQLTSRTIRGLNSANLSETWPNLPKIAVKNKTVVRIIWHRAALPPRVDGSFSRIRQVVPRCSPCNTWLIGPARVCSPNGILIGSSVFAGLTGVPNTQTHLTDISHE